MGLPCKSYQLHSALSEIVSLVYVFSDDYINIRHCLLTARPWVECGSCFARGLFLFLFFFREGTIFQKTVLTKYAR